MAGGSWTTQAHRAATCPRAIATPTRSSIARPASWRTSPSATGASSTTWACPAAAGSRDSATISRSARWPPSARQRRPFGPDSPTVLTIKVLFAQPGLPIGEQGARGRAELLATSFAQYERAFREQLGDMFAAGRLRSAPRHRGDHPQSVGPRVRESAARLLLRHRRPARAARRAAQPAAWSHRVREHRPLRRDGSPQLDPRGRSRGEAARRMSAASMLSSPGVRAQQSLLSSLASEVGACCHPERAKRVEGSAPRSLSPPRWLPVAHLRRARRAQRSQRTYELRDGPLARRRRLPARHPLRRRRDDSRASAPHTSTPSSISPAAGSSRPSAKRTTTTSTTRRHAAPTPCSRATCTTACST